jgi:hypothetical protein
MKYTPPAILSVENASKAFAASPKGANFRSAKGDGESDSQILPSRTVGPAYSANC